MADFSLLLLAVFWILPIAELANPLTQCDSASHICEGRCPPLPWGARLPPDSVGLCLKEPSSGACVCWLQNPFTEGHSQALFKCEVVANGTREARHVMCLAPRICFPPGLGCMIVLHCPCAEPAGGQQYGVWRSVHAIILSSRTPVRTAFSQKSPPFEEKPEVSSEVREFSVKHLLFLLAFVVGPLFCWCLLTFFHEGKCRKKPPSPETEPMPTERGEEMNSPRPPPSCPPLPPPAIPKYESPPPYREDVDLGEEHFLECPPPSYEDAMRDSSRLGMHGVQDSDNV